MGVVMDTLVLSNTYVPLGRVSWFRAFNMVWNGRAEVLEVYADKCIGSFSQTFPMPSVIRFVRKVTGYFRRGIRFNRRNVWTRDKGNCQYCGRHVSQREFTFDHVVPLSQGGKTVWENIVVACVTCNQKKQGRTPKQAGMRLLSEPQKPKSLPALDLDRMWGTEIPETWKDYLGSYRYWHGDLKD
jgi:5-methylcytosine-specific restriction endonuclease McrA